MRGAFVIVVVVACSSKKNEAPARDEAKTPPRTPTTTTPATRPTGAAGVAPIASLPRADWPCAREVEPIGARITYDYTGAPAACSFPPDLWLPGCPTRHQQGNADLGLAIDVLYRYDEQHRLIGIDSKLRMLTVSDIKYDGDKVVSRDHGLTYYPVGTSTQVWDPDGSLFAIADHRTGGGLQRVRTSLAAPDDPVPATEEKFEYTGSRLATIAAHALGMAETHTFEYDCK